MADARRIPSQGVDRSIVAYFNFYQAPFNQVIIWDSWKMFSWPQDNKLSVSDSHVKVKGLCCLFVCLFVFNFHLSSALF